MGTLLAGGTIFVSAFLLFQIQPMTAKAILPWFGGSAAVWGTCLMFFQSVLFLGYAYAHVLTTKVPVKKQLWVHGALLAGSLLLLPVLPSEFWKPLGSEDPISRILLLLTATVGLPYFLLSSTSPLVQAWYARRSVGSLPYRYFALSNFASLAALLGYPTLVEPSIALQAQGWFWAGGYIAFAAGCTALGWYCTQSGTAKSGESSAAVQAVSKTDADVSVEPVEDTAPAFGTKLHWMLLAAVASTLSLSVTNHLTQNVAPIPFLWVLPLAIYLITFILCFESDGWYKQKPMMALHATALAGLAYMGVKVTPDVNIRWVIAALVIGLFFMCMFCHGELARRKPSSKYLTEFYLMISAGGAIGALAVGLGAPYFLNGSYDLPLALGTCAMFTLLMEYRKHWATDIVWAGVAIGVLASSGLQILAYRAPALVMSRSFYGGLRVVEDEETRSFVHGSIKHGVQLLAPELSLTPTAYFAEGTGVGRAIRVSQEPGKPQKIGVIGLGAGTLAAYARPGDFYRFYELDPNVVFYAQNYFTFLEDSPAEIDVVVGDGRLSLERQEPQDYDIFVVDAFSGDAIPVHLLSREAMEVYFRNIKPEGLLAFHVSNTALSLAPVVKRLAEDMGYSAIRFYAQPDEAAHRSEADWVLVARSPELLDRPEFLHHTEPFTQISGLRVWTDDYSTLFPILK